jgi:hypothetical protein
MIKLSLASYKKELQSIHSKNAVWGSIGKPILAF